MVDGGDGYDVALIADTRGLTLDLGGTNLEAATGNDGNDVLFTTGTAGMRKSEEIGVREIGVRGNRGQSPILHDQSRQMGRPA